jgi:hypothetical protein
LRSPTVRKKAVTVGSIGLAVGLLGGIVALGLAADKDTGWWAAWGQWVGGIGSIAAAGAALWIAWRGWARADAERRDSEADQARLISADWRGSGKAERGMYQGWALYVDNHSAQPVYDVAAEAMWARHSDTPGQWECRPGWGATQIESMPPQSTRPMKVSWRPHQPKPTEAEHGRIYATISFTDGNGRRWRRTSGMQPERMRLGQFVKPESRSRWFRRASEPGPPGPPGLPPTPPTSQP